MQQAPRMTLQTRLVLSAMLASPTSEYYGLQLCEETGLPSGTIYPILARLEQAGWVVSSWEDPAERISEGRPRRRYYRLADEGAAREGLDRAYHPKKQPRFGIGILWPDLPRVSP